MGHTGNVFRRITVRKTVNRQEILTVCTLVSEHSAKALTTELYVDQTYVILKIVKNSINNSANESSQCFQIRSLETLELIKSMDYSFQGCSNYFNGLLILQTKENGNLILR